MLRKKTLSVILVALLLLVLAPMLVLALSAPDKNVKNDISTVDNCCAEEVATTEDAAGSVNLVNDVDKDETKEVGALAASCCTVSEETDAATVEEAARYRCIKCGRYVSAAAMPAFVCVGEPCPIVCTCRVTGAYYETEYL